MRNNVDKTSKMNTLSLKCNMTARSMSNVCGHWPPGTIALYIYCIVVDIRVGHTHFKQNGKINLDNDFLINTNSS